MSGTSTTVNATTVKMSAAAICDAAVAVEARIAIITAAYSIGGVANSRPATKTIPSDPASSRHWIDRTREPIVAFGCSAGTATLSPVTVTGVRWRDHMRAAASTASAPATI